MASLSFGLYLFSFCSQVQVHHEQYTGHFQHVFENNPGRMPWRVPGIISRHVAGKGRRIK